MKDYFNEPVDLYGQLRNKVDYVLPQYSILKYPIAKL